MTSTTLAVGTSYYLLPKTTSNVFQHLERLEKRYPQLQAAHQNVNKSVDDVYKQVDSTLVQLRGAVDENAAKLREQIEQNTQLVKNQVNSAVGSTDTKGKFDEVKKNVESMYSTRSNVKSNVYITWANLSLYVAWCWGNFEKEQLNGYLEICIKHIFDVEKKLCLFLSYWLRMKSRKFFFFIIQNF